MSNKSTATIATMGIDIGKNSFHVVGLDQRGAIVLRQKWSRNQIEARLAAMPPCLIGMEACVGAHHLSRKLQALGHDARLMPAKYVRAYSKGQKNDFPRRGSDCRGGAASDDEIRRRMMPKARPDYLISAPAERACAEIKVCRDKSIGLMGAATYPLRAADRRSSKATLKALLPNRLLPFRLPARARCARSAAGGLPSASTTGSKRFLAACARILLSFPT
jgi:hypothetical protein